MKKLDRVFAQHTPYFGSEHFSITLPSEQPDNETKCKDGRDPDLESANRLADTLWQEPAERH